MEVLDHGYLIKIEHWGSDERIIEAARMSTNKGFLGWEPGPCPACDSLNTAYVPHSEDGPCRSCDGKGRIRGDKLLLKYLYENWHRTPFEMAGMTIEVKAPIFVFREWHRHRTQSYNEMSARYVPLPNDNYLPTVERCLVVNTKNKQAGSVAGVVSHDQALMWLECLDALYVHSQKVYELGLEAGIPKELARLATTVGRYSKMRASANLRNIFAFLTLRQDSDTQEETRRYANAWASLVKDTFPRTFELYAKGAGIE